MPPRGYHKPARELRTKQFTFWVTPAEKEHIRDVARRAGLTPSAYVRAVALGNRPAPRPGDENRELLRQLSRIGNNLNQLHRIAQSRGPAYLTVINDARKVVQESLRAFATSEARRAAAPEALAELVHHGATLNALAHHANSRRFPAATELRPALADVVAAVGALRP